MVPKNFPSYSKSSDHFIFSLISILTNCFSCLFCLTIDCITFVLTRDLSSFQVKVGSIYIWLTVVHNECQCTSSPFVIDYITVSLIKINQLCKRLRQFIDLSQVRTAHLHGLSKPSTDRLLAFLVYSPPTGKGVGTRFLVHRTYKQRTLGALLALWSPWLKDSTLSQPLLAFLCYTHYVLFMISLMLVLVNNLFT